MSDLQQPEQVLPSYVFFLQQPLLPFYNSLCCTCACLSTRALWGTWMCLPTRVQPSCTCRFSVYNFFGFVSNRYVQYVLVFSSSKQAKILFLVLWNKAKNSGTDWVSVLFAPKTKNIVIFFGDTLVWRLSEYQFISEVPIFDTFTSFKSRQSARTPCGIYWLSC